MALDSERLRPECVDCPARQKDPTRIWTCVGSSFDSRPSHWTPCPEERIPSTPIPYFDVEEPALHHYREWDDAWREALGLPDDSSSDKPSRLRGLLRRLL